MLGPSLKADVIDSDEARTGERKEGTFFSAWGFVSKGAIGIAIALSGSGVVQHGFRPNAVQTPEALAGIRGLVSAFPMVCHVLALLLLGRLRMNESRSSDAARSRQAARRGVCARDRGGAVMTSWIQAALPLVLVLSNGCAPFAKIDLGRLITSGGTAGNIPSG